MWDDPYDEYETPGTPVSDAAAKEFCKTYELCEAAAEKRAELIDIVAALEAYIEWRKQALMDEITKTLAPADREREWRVVRDRATGQVLIQYKRGARARTPAWADELRQKIEGGQG